MRSVYLALVFLVFLAIVVNDAVGLYMVKLEKVREEIAVCEVSFQRNKCQKPVPLTEMECKKWKMCMDKNPDDVAYEQFICFECFVQIFSKMVDNLSGKSIFFIAAVLMMYFGRR
jgi:hypothetical protein